MLTPTEVRYLEICLRKIEKRETDQDLATLFGVGVNTVWRAVRWGRDNQIFDATAESRLSRHISECRKRIRFLESQLKLVKSQSVNKEDGKPKPIHPYHLDVLTRQIRDENTLLMELEGLYRKTLNVHHSGGDLPQIAFIVPAAGDGSQSGGSGDGG